MSVTSERRRNDRRMVDAMRQMFGMRPLYCWRERSVSRRWILELALAGRTAYGKNPRTPRVGHRDG